MRIIAALIIVLGFMTASSAFSAEVSMNGLVQTWLASGSQASNSTFPENEIILRRARVGINIELNEVITGKFQTDKIDPVEIIDAEVDLTLHPLLKIRVGRMKYDFDIQGRTSPKALAFPTRPIPTRRITGLMASSPGAFRMEGVELTGTTQLSGLGFAVGVFNGQDVAVPTDEDGYAYLINLHAKPMEQLKLNASYMTEDTSDADSETIWVVGLLYQKEGIVFGAEYYSASIEATGVAPVDPAGYYAYVTYRLGDFEFGGRYQALDFDATDTDDISSIDLKFSYYLVEGKAYQVPKLTLLAEFRDAGSDYVSTGALTFDEKGTGYVTGDDVDNVFILELSVPL